MNRREKLLSVLVGVLAVGFLLYFGVSRYRGALKSRQDHLAKLGDDIRREEATKRKIALQKKALDAANEQSLPKDFDAASLKYNQWLRSTLDAHFPPTFELTNQGISSIKFGEEYATLKLLVSGATGTWSDVSGFLYDFYRANHLHKISNLIVRPLSKDNRSEVRVEKIYIEALILPGAKHENELNDGIADHRLVLDDLSRYRGLIGGRSLFAAYQPLTMGAIAGGSVVYDNALVIQPTVSKDPRAAAMTFTLNEDAPENATINPQTGEFSWTPTAEQAGATINPDTGEVTWPESDSPISKRYNFTISVKDLTGLAAEQAFSVNVLKEEPPRVVRQANTPDFSAAQARAARFTAGFAWEDGTKFVWLWDRSQPPDRAYQSLHENDRFTVGIWQGTLKSIDENFDVVVTFDNDQAGEGTLRRIKSGESLADSVIVKNEGGGAN